MHQLLAAGALLLGLAGPALAADMAQVGEVMIEQPWARASIGNAPNSAAYMVLETAGGEPDRLVASSTPIAEKAQLHSHSMEGGSPNRPQLNRSNKEHFPSRYSL
jgi:copper(I)-binding protein